MTPNASGARCRSFVRVDGPHLGPAKDGSGPTRCRRTSTSASATATGTPTGSADPAPSCEPFEDFSLFRKQITVTPSPIVRARAYMSAGQQFDLRVNGVRVAHGPSFAYPDEQYYEATDITQAARRRAPRT